MKNRFLEYFKENNTVLSVILALFIQAVALCLLESYYYVVTDITFIKYLYNLLFWLLLTAFFTFITGRLRWGCFITTLISLVLGTVEYAVMTFRDSPILPWDLLSLGTALSVAGNYKFELTERIITIYIAYAVLLGLCFFITAKITRKKLLVRSAGVILSLALCFGFCELSQQTDFQTAIGYYPYLFTPKAVYKRNGFAFSFASLIKYLDIDAPKGYDSQELEEFTAKYESGSADTDSQNKRPNIIVVMNEAFSDLSVLGDFDSSEDCMPFFRSLTENAIKGYAYVSVNGGNTANSEYEFLTGETMAFLPGGSIPYQQYIKGKYTTLVENLNDLGYYTISMHPYRASGWYRSSVYEYFGFTNKYFQNSFKKADLRSYVSDQSCYEKLIDLYENHKRIDDSPFFSFCITMQNHGGYSDSTSYDNFNQKIKAYTKSNSDAVSSYLSLIKYSDEALEYLVEYYKSADEPTIILFFGDHLPTTFITSPILRENGIDPNSELNTDVFTSLYQVPFVLWANYDIEEKQGVNTSLNYLGTLLCETAGLPLSGYQKYLKDLSKEYPVITANFVMDKAGNTTYISDAVKSPQLIRYNQIQYNKMFDKNGYISRFYSLSK